jgi:glycosyltransferase involved in cell wall biosynthesis
VIPRQVRHFAYVDATLIRYQPRSVSASALRSYRDVTRRYLDSMNAVFAMNEWVRTSYIEDYGFPAERVFNVGFGVNVTPFAGEKNYDDNLLLIILRRATASVKGLDLLLEALPMVRRELPGTRLAVVGTSLPNPMDGVEFYEGYPREKTVELLRKATLYTMPALSEPNGIAYLEALAHKTPILGLDRYAFPEFSGYGRYGFAVRTASAEAVAAQIVAALGDRKLLREMGEEGQRFVLERYTWKRTVDAMADVMQSAG